VLTTSQANASIPLRVAHARIDLLKMDIEGAECDVIQDLIASAIVVKQLLVEFHHRWKEISVSKTKEAIRHLNVAGYLIFAISPNGEGYGFLNFDGPRG
jgi:Methyltransferase FkbM domain